VPAVLGAPTEVRLSDAVPGGLVTLLYGDRIALSQFRGGAVPFVEKTVGPGTSVRRTEVKGAPAAFISGASSHVVVQDADGVVVAGTAALADANVLVWDDADGIAHRLEIHAGRQEALRIARSLR
jgi:RES domain-containing protein